jgi:FMN phosphatase YigB (HAD superfamily)
MVSKTEGSMTNFKTKVIVFDLDGTLYEDTHHFEYYAKRLQSKLPTEKQAQFWEDYQLAQQGEHALKVGRCYDVKRDLILVQEHNHVNEAYTWDGSLQSGEEISIFYPNPIVIDQLHIISIGDLWWLPITIARHYGLSANHSYKAFLETRSYMMGPEFSMTRVPGFVETLTKLRQKGFKLTLLTNSPEPDSEVILTKLGLEKLFDLKIFEGKKPTHTAKRFSVIKEHFQVEYNQIVSVGDNWINEILPASELGCSTILIDPYFVSKKADANHIVRDLSQLIPLLAEMLT